MERRIQVDKGGYDASIYNWGNQQRDSEFIAEAEFAGTQTQFLEGWFPQADPSLSR
jgi:hypothetical protein